MQELQADLIQFIHITARHRIAIGCINRPHHIAGNCTFNYVTGFGDAVNNCIQAQTTAQKHIHHRLQVDLIIAQECLPVASHENAVILDQFCCNVAQGRLQLHAGSGSHTHYKRDLAVLLVGDKGHTQAVCLAAYGNRHSLAGGDSLIHAIHHGHKLLPCNIHRRAGNDAGAVCKQCVKGHCAGGTGVKGIGSACCCKNRSADGVIKADLAIGGGRQGDDRVVVVEALLVTHALALLILEFHGILLRLIDHSHLGGGSCQLIAGCGDLPGLTRFFIMHFIHSSGGFCARKCSLQLGNVLCIQLHAFVVGIVEDYADRLGLLHCSVAVLDDHLNGNVFPADAGNTQHLAQHGRLLHAFGGVLLHFLLVCKEGFSQHLQIAGSCIGADAFIEGTQQIHGFLHRILHFVDSVDIVAVTGTIQHTLQRRILADGKQVFIQIIQLLLKDALILIVVSQLSGIIKILIAPHISINEEISRRAVTAVVAANKVNGIHRLLRHSLVGVCDHALDHGELTVDLTQSCVLSGQLIQPLQLVFCLLNQIIGQVQHLNRRFPSQPHSLPRELQLIIHLYGVKFIADLCRILAVSHRLTKRDRIARRFSGHRRCGRRNPIQCCAIGQIALGGHCVSAALVCLNSQQFVCFFRRTQAHRVNIQCIQLQNSRRRHIIRRIIVGYDHALVVDLPRLTLGAGNNCITRDANSLALIHGIAVHSIVPDLTLAGHSRQRQSEAIGQLSVLQLAENILAAHSRNGIHLRSICNGVGVLLAVYQTHICIDLGRNGHIHIIIVGSHIAGCPVVQLQHIGRIALVFNQLFNVTLLGSGRQPNRCGIFCQIVCGESAVLVYLCLHHHVHGGLCHVSRNISGIRQQCRLVGSRFAGCRHVVHQLFQRRRIGSALHQAVQRRPVKAHAGLNIADNAVHRALHSGAQSVPCGVVHRRYFHIHRGCLCQSRFQLRLDIRIVLGQSKNICSLAAGCPHIHDIQSAIFGIGRQVIHSDPILFGAGCPLNARIGKRLATVFINIKGKTVSALLVKGIQHLPHRRRNKVGSAVVVVGIFAETDVQLQA